MKFKDFIVGDMPVVLAGGGVAGDAAFVKLHPSAKDGATRQGAESGIFRMMKPGWLDTESTYGIKSGRAIPPLFLPEI